MARGFINFTEMRRIFIDLGAHIGESAKFFRKHHPEGNTFEVFCFEPEPGNIEILEQLKDVWNLRIIPKAASYYNSTAKLYTGMSESGSLYQEKRTGGLDGETHVIVETIDFIEWLNELVSSDYVPEIWLKMNIEGEEYEIIPRMHEFGLLKFVHRFYINWHWKKIGVPKELHDRIKAMIPEDKIFRWWAMFGEDNIQWFKDSL